MSEEELPEWARVLVARIVDASEVRVVAWQGEMKDMQSRLDKHQAELDARAQVKTRKVESNLAVETRVEATKQVGAQMYARIRCNFGVEQELAQLRSEIDELKAKPGVFSVFSAQARGK